jgi:hypothetical protein
MPKQRKNTAQGRTRASVAKRRNTVANEDSADAFPALQWALPWMHGFLMLLCLPWIISLPIAIGFGVVTVLTGLYAFLLSTRGVMMLVPTLPSHQAFHLANYCLTPVWASELLRIIALEAYFPHEEFGLAKLFRNVFRPQQITGDPFELITVAGTLLMVWRLRRSASENGIAIPIWKLAGGATAFAGMYAISYLLNGLIAVYLIGSFFPQTFSPSAQADTIARFTPQQ